MKAYSKSAKLLALVFSSLVFALPVYSNYREIVLTEAEKAYVDSHQEKNAIKVGMLGNFPPISSYDKKNDSCSGILISILEIISQKTGLTFEHEHYFPSPNIPTPSELILQNKVELFMGLYKTENHINNKKLTLSEDIFDGSLCFVSKNNHNFARKNGKIEIALVKSLSSVQKDIKEVFPQSNINIYNTLEECLDAVINNKVDAFIHNKYALIYLLQKPIYEDLELSDAFSIPLNFCIGASSDSNPLLLDIINKAIKSIDKDTISYIIMDHTVGKPYQLTREDYKHKYKFVITAILVLIVIIIGTAILLISLNQINLKNLNKAYNQVKESLAVAEKANSAKSLFTSRMSHEIRTPLNAVIGYMTIAKNSPEDTDKVLDCITKADIAAKHLLSLLNDVLDLSSIENGKMKLVHEPFDLKQIISSTTSIFSEQTRLKGQKFGVFLHDVTEENLIGDALRLNQILMNLLSNAVKFTPNGGKINFNITQKAINGKNVFLRFSVQDTGIGMDESFIKNLFNPYEQENTSISRSFGGSGLGLSITKQFITMMGGAISVKSKKGEGSEFAVDLPFEIKKIQQPEIDKEIDFSQIRVLIVDDDINACEYMQIILKRCGVVCESVLNGHKAIEVLKEAEKAQQPFSICLMDWYMPDMCGIDAVKQIRSAGFTKLKIIFVTAFDYSEITEAAAAIGITKIIAKPLFQSVMLDILVNTFGKYKQTDNIDNEKFHFSGKRVLLAEDNTMNLEIATEILEQTGLIVDKAMNGREAYNIFRNSDQGTYDAILMDIQMPVMDGYESARAIRASNHPDAKTIPIIAMTANAFAEDIAASFSAGMNDHVSKPIEVKRLFVVLKNCFSIHQKNDDNA